MTETLPDNIEPYPNISPKAYEHPADRAATAALKAVPMLDTVVRKLIEWRYERALRQFYLGNSVRVGERQLPDLWAHHVAVCQILDMPKTYDLYVTDTVVANAMVIGSQNPMVIGDSSAGPARIRRAARRARPRGRAHPLRPRALQDRAGHPPARRRRRSVPAGDSVRGGPGGPARVVPRRRAELRPRRGARRPRPADRLPRPDGARRRDARRSTQPRRVPRAGARVRGLGRPQRPRAALLLRDQQHPSRTPSDASPRS